MQHTVIFGLFTFSLGGIQNRRTK